MQTCSMICSGQITFHNECVTCSKGAKTALSVSHHLCHGLVMVIQTIGSLEVDPEGAVPVL